MPFDSLDFEPVHGLLLRTSAGEDAVGKGPEDRSNVSGGRARKAPDGHRVR